MSVTLPPLSSLIGDVDKKVPSRAPGVLLCFLVTAASYGIAYLEQRTFGDTWLEALVIAIVLGTAIRTVWTPDAIWLPGIRFSAKTLLEIAVVLLGASLSGAMILAVGPMLLLGIVGVVFVTIAASFALGRALGLPKRMAMLVACGNSICGNSAIAAVAPVIGAKSEDVAASIAFTAVLGVAVVLGLPLVAYGLHLSGLQYGMLAGLTVYAVPQVIAAAAPLGTTAIQIGTLVKLVRVLMLGPVCVVLSFLAPRFRETGEICAQTGVAAKNPERLPLHQLVPWFVIGFLALAVLRSLGFVPDILLAPASHLAGLLTVAAMAALGLGVDLRTVAKAGGRVMAAVVLSLLVLGAISLGLIYALGIA